MNTWKDVQHQSLSGKCKSKPQWGTISHQLEWLPSKSLQTINAGEGVEKGNPLRLLVGMQTNIATMENSVEKLLSRVLLFATPCTVAYQAHPSTGFSRQEYWSGLPFPSPRDLPNPGTEPRCPALQTDSLPSEPPGKPHNWILLNPTAMCSNMDGPTEYYT